jgi:uncharacterized membrane protein
MQRTNETTVSRGEGKGARRLALSGIVIAIYVVVMFLTQTFSFGQYQVRVATSIYALAAIHPFLILPLGIANLLSNTLMGGLGILDMAGGFLVGIFTSTLCYQLRKVHVSLVALPIILIPTLLVPIWLSYLLNIPYAVLAISLLVGQIVPGIVGVFLVKHLEKPLMRF